MKIAGENIVSQKGNNNQVDIGSSQKRWYEKPLGIILLTVVAGLMVAFFASYFGLV